MAVFHYLAMPLFALLVGSLYGPDIEERKRQAIQYLKGMILLVPALIAFVILEANLQRSFRPFFIFLYHFVTDHFLFYAVLMAGYVLFGKPSNVRKSNFPQICLFAAGYYTLVSIFSLLLRYGRYDIYQLFYLPILRICIVVLFSLFVEKIINGYGLLRVGYGALLLSVPFWASAATYLYAIHRFFFALLSLILMAAFSAGLWRLLRER